MTKVNRRQYTPKRWRRMIDMLIPDADNDDLLNYDNRHRSAWYTINIECRNKLFIDPDKDRVCGIRSGIILPHLRMEPMLPARYEKRTEMFSNLLYGQSVKRRIVVWYPTPKQYGDYGRISPGRT